MFKPVLLWTDGLIFLLVAIVIFFIIYAVRREHLRAPWRQVIRSKIGFVSLLVLMSYVVVAVLDSMHYRLPLQQENSSGEIHYSVEVLSVLDAIIMPLKENEEKTYSSPLAIKLFSQETVELANGEKSRIHPRLKYGGVNLKDADAEHSSDVVMAAVRGVITGLLAAATLILIVLNVLARKRSVSIFKMFRSIRLREEKIPWFVVFVAGSLMFVLIAVGVSLSQGYHVLGTDKVGQDVLYQAIKSIRTALAIGTLTTLVMLPFAVLLGIMAGYFRGLIDDLIQYIYTTLNSIPGVLLIAAAILILQVYIDGHPELFSTDAERADMRLLFLCLILGITSWTGLCRLLRGETLKLREVEYVQAAAAFGVGKFKIIMRHLLPNVMHIILISIVLDFSGLVLAEAVLSYVGVGVDPSMHSWGNMINSARLEMAREPMVWWSLMAAFVFMFVLVLAANLFSDVVRDAFDPRLRKG